VREFGHLKKYKTNLYFKISLNNSLFVRRYFTQGFLNLCSIIDVELKISIEILRSLPTRIIYKRWYVFLFM